MAIKLAPAKPDDRYARLYFVFKEDDGAFSVEARHEDEADEKAGWIEFWSEDAKACKEPLRRIGGRLYVLGERRDKRSKELSDDKAVAELEEYNRLIVEGLAHRTKAWRLVDSQGAEVDAPLTFENAKEIYSDEDHNLREVVQEFLKAGNFTQRAKKGSSTSPDQESAPPSRARTK